MQPTSNNEELFQQVKKLILTARTETTKYVNYKMVNTYFEVGRMIVEYEQDGSAAAEYGKEIIRNLSEKLTAEFDRGFSYRNLNLMRKFYLTYKRRIVQNVSAQFKLGFSHYVFLLKIKDEQERNFYEIEAAANQ